MVLHFKTESRTLCAVQTRGMLCPAQRVSVVFLCSLKAASFREASVSRPTFSTLGGPISLRRDVKITLRNLKQLASYECNLFYTSRQLILSWYSVCERDPFSDGSQAVPASLHVLRLPASKHPGCPCQH